MLSRNTAKQVRFLAAKAYHKKLILYSCYLHVYRAGNCSINIALFLLSRREGGVFVIGEGTGNRRIRLGTVMGRGPY